MKVDKYNVSSKSGAALWVLVEHGRDINSLKLDEGYAIKGFVSTFELDNNPELNLNNEQAIGCMNDRGCYFGTTINTCAT